MLGGLKKYRLTIPAVALNATLQARLDTESAKHDDGDA
jgi:hypothetical protein